MRLVAAVSKPFAKIMLVTMVWRKQVDQILAPTGKKKVAAEGPARFKKDLPTYIKNIKPTDPIIVIGCSSEPWNADQKSLKCVLAYLLFVFF